MGSGTWNSSVYTARTASKLASGTPTFAYSHSTTTTQPRSAWKPHDTLDPKDVIVRESRDSAEHPTSVAIGVLFDVTGSMTTIPGVLQKRLPDLLGLIQQKNYIEHPQILFGAIGDATCDRVPLQVGQFESDNLLEGGGGGQNTESYELALYFMARHTSLDCVEKRNKKGYLYIIGDEKPYSQVKGAEVANTIGGSMNPQENIDFADILKEAQQKFEVFYVLPKYAHHGDDPDIIDFWKNALGDHLLFMDDADDVCETIGLSIATQEALANPLIP
jgi:hypothetical protein